MAKLPVYLFGEVLFDQFPDTAPVLGGAPFNVAWHLRGFGERSYLVSAVGNDEAGNKVRQAMSDWDMPLDYLQINNEHPTGVVNVSFNDGEPCYHIQEHCAWDYINAALLPELQQASLIYHGTLATRNPCSAHSLERMTTGSLERMTDAGLAPLPDKNLQHLSDSRLHKLFIDVNLREPWWQYQQVIDAIHGAHYVKLNEHELRILTEGKVSTFNAESTIGSRWYEAAIAFKNSHNIVNMLLTQGADGAVLIDATGEMYKVEAPAAAPPIVDTVGAGDAFTSVALLGMLNDWDCQTTLERAQQFASFVITQRGATCSDMAIYRDFCNLWGIV
jgi:fructokinase